ncbi:MAG: MFS transporter [Acetobacteraceae bacterium]|nr:MFS transporter [Acetobacteraceae bacterium]
MKTDLSILPLLALAAFATGGGIRMLDPLLPSLASDFGVTVAGAAPVLAGFSIAYGAGQLVIGPLGDRYGKLRVAWFALLLYGFGLAACTLAWDLSAMVALRTLTGLLAGAVIPLALAWIGDAVPYAERQATIGRFLTGMVMAQLLVGPLSGVLAEFFGWRASFLVLALLALVVSVLLGRRLLWQATASEAGRGFRGSFRPYLTLLSRAPGQRLMVAAFIDGAVLFGGAFPLTGSLLIERFEYSPAMAGLVVAGFGLGAFTYTRLAKTLVARFGETRLLTLGGVLLALGLVGTALAPNGLVVAAMQFWLGLAFYMLHGVLQARATEALPEARGTAVAAFAMALFFGQSIGALVFGTILHMAGYAAVFVVAAMATLGLMVWSRRLLSA